MPNGAMDGASRRARLSLARMDAGAPPDLNMMIDVIASQALACVLHAKPRCLQGAGLFHVRTPTRPVGRVGAPISRVAAGAARRIPARRARPASMRGSAARAPP